MRLRRVLFQVHLWIALTLGLYIVVISVSGSIAVFRREASLWLIPRTVASTEGERLTDEALDAAVRRVYSGYEVVGISEQFGRRGADPALRPVDVALVVLLVLTGTIIWWQGRWRWWRGLIVSRSARRPYLWQLHRAMGFWSCILLFIWALTAAYFAFPTPVEALIDRFDPDLDDFHRPGEAFLLQLIALHFGRFGGLEVRITWAILGLVPAALFITGFIVWWRRVVRPRFRRLESPQARVAVIEPLEDPSRRVS
jgi:uncharacterized iron-regulated membrane protein